MLFRLLLAFVLGMCACAREQASSNVRYFASDDAEMNAAIDSARATVPILLRRLSHPPASQSYLSVKIPIKEAGTTEHIWLDSIQVDGDYIRGQLNDSGVEVAARLGQWVSIRTDQISDWIVIDNGLLCGGYTIRVERAREQRADRPAFDRGLAWTGLVRWAIRPEC